MTVKAILSAKGREVATVAPDATLDEAAKTLAARRIGALVVIGAGGHVVGILSERDVVAALAQRGASALRERITTAMTREVATCRESDTVGELMEQMTHGRFRHLPVIEEGRLAGIVSIGDVVKIRLQEMEQESSALRDYIRTA